MSATLRLNMPGTIASKAFRRYDINPAVIRGFGHHYDAVAGEDTWKRIVGFLEMTRKADSRCASAQCAMVRRRVQRKQYVQSSYSRMR
jgi:hypothetical protein